VHLQLCYTPLLISAPLQQTVIFGVKLLLVVVGAHSFVSQQSRCCWRRLRAQHERRHISPRWSAAGMYVEYVDLLPCLRFDHDLDSPIPRRVQKQAVADLSEDIVDIDGSRQLCHDEKSVACWTW
jgi:hypothetical protein